MYALNPNYSQSIEFRSPGAPVPGKVHNTISVQTSSCGWTNFLRFAHDLLTNFMAGHGFNVTKHYLGLETAWRAEFSQGTGGRVIGVNAEMDALEGMGHACGHNLIAVSGVGIAVAMKAALQSQQHVSGKVVLLGTPGM